MSLKLSDGRIGGDLVRLGEARLTQMAIYRGTSLIRETAPPPRRVEKKKKGPGAGRGARGGCAVVPLHSTDVLTAAADVASTRALLHDPPDPGYPPQCHSP